MTEQRNLIDPDHRYPAEGLRVVEQRAVRLLQVFPQARMERTRNVFEMTVGGEKGVVLLATAEALEIRLPTVEWTMGAYGPADAARLVRRVKWGRMSDGKLRALVEAAMEQRGAEFAVCRYCGREFPPEHRHGDTCHACAERKLGIVH